MGCFRLPSVPRRADCCLSGWAASIAAASPRLPYCSARGLASLPLRQRQQLCSRRQQAAPGRCRAPQPCQAAAGPAAAAAPAAGSSFWSGLVQAWSSNPAAVLLAGAACLLGLSLSVFLLSAIPTMLAFRRSAAAAEALLRALHAEVPDTAAAVRLTTMDMSDAIGEVAALSNDLTEGVRASARAIVGAEQGVRQGVALAGQAVTGYMVPAAKRKGQEARGALESVLKERAHLRHTEPAVREMATATKAAAQRLRFALASARLASSAAAAAAGLRRDSGRSGVDQRLQGGGAAPGSTWGQPAV